MDIHILVVEDETLIRKTLVRKLLREGFTIHEAENGAEARELFGSRVWDLVLLDINLPDTTGLDLLSEFREQDAELPVIMLTGNQSVDYVVRAMQLGALNYLTKPFNLEELTLTIHKALEMTELRRQVRYFRENSSKEFGFDKIIGPSDEMQTVMEMAGTVAQSEARSVIILGESGTGKNMIAQAIHYNSNRASKPFMEITCTALSETLMESELFGHERGAFTDARSQKRGLCELAHGGTLFLDEIGDLPLGIQAKLLGFLESRRFRRVGGTRDIEVDVRVVVATNRDLEKEVKEKRFREDLYYRLNVIEIDIPPLRERAEDIVPIAEFFVDKYNKSFKKNIAGLTNDAATAIKEYSWPGNIRELRNLVERAMILTKGMRLDLEDLPLKSRYLAQQPTESNGEFILPANGISLDAVEEGLVRQALKRTRGNQTKAAKLLQLSRDQLRYRMKQYNLFDLEF